MTSMATAEEGLQEAEAPAGKMAAPMTMVAGPTTDLLTIAIAETVAEGTAEKARTAGKNLMGVRAEGPTSTETPASSAPTTMTRSSLDAPLPRATRRSGSSFASLRRGRPTRRRPRSRTRRLPRSLTPSGVSSTSTATTPSRSASSPATRRAASTSAKMRASIAISRRDRSGQKNPRIS